MDGKLFRTIIYFIEFVKLLNIIIINIILFNYIMNNLYYILFTILISIIIRSILVKKNFTEEFSILDCFPTDITCLVKEELKTLFSNTDLINVIKDSTGIDIGAVKTNVNNLITDINILQNNVPIISDDITAITNSYNANIPLIQRDLRITTSDMQLSMEIFREIQKLFYDSIKVLQDISVIIKKVSEILYLITMKLNFCFEGIKDSNNKTIEKLLEIKQIIFNLLIKISGCMGKTPFIGINIKNYKEILNNYINNCVSGWPNIINIIKTSVVELENISLIYKNNSKLFPQSKSTIDGETNDWCKKNVNSKAPLKDIIKCNQCFNFIAIISEELSELTSIEKFVIDVENILFDIEIIAKLFSKFKVLDLSFVLPNLIAPDLTGWKSFSL